MRGRAEQTALTKQKVSIIENESPNSQRIAEILWKKLEAAGFEVCRTDVDGAALVICIGGDGSFLATLARFDFPEVPFVGINTGHLGFFQELDEEDIDLFIESYLKGAYVRQTYRTVSATIECEDRAIEVQGLNEVVIKNAHSRLAHLDIYIGENFIEKFSGDGVVVSTPAGSTAYNYSLGGSIVDPRLNVLQLTPIAPINSAAYRSFTAGILLPPDLSVGISPASADARDILVSVDGNQLAPQDVQRISIGFGPGTVELLRFKDYQFWNTVKQKLLLP
jgi:NAD+ kinase